MEHNRIKRFNENSELNSELSNDTSSSISDVSCSIRYSESEEMIQIINQDGKVVFGGNYWDFNRNPESFKRLFESLGLKVSMDDTYRYE